MAIILSNILRNLEDWSWVPGPFQFGNLPQLFDNQLCQIPVFHLFEKVNKGQLKWVNVNH